MTPAFRIWFALISLSLALVGLAVTFGLPGAGGFSFYGVLSTFGGFGGFGLAVLGGK